MRKSIAYVLAVVLAVSCIDNDLPLPVVTGAFYSVAVEDADEVVVDKYLSQVRISLTENADPRKVKIVSASFENEGTTTEPPIVGTHDLSSPLTVILRTYQDYEWTVVATQNIERYFRVDGQIGPSVVDAPNRRAIAYVGAGADLRNISVTALKLGPANATSYSISPSDMKDFTEGIKVDITYRGITEQWSLYVENSDVSVAVALIDPWTTRARVVGSGAEGKECGFRYRPTLSQEWSVCANVPLVDGNFTAFLENLLPETSYECKAYNGDDESEIYIFETEPATQIPNRGFEGYSPAESKYYYSWFDPSSSDPTVREKWWDSGNAGSTTVGSSYCVAEPDTKDFKEGSTSAKLSSHNVIVKFAAGNTFAGEFVKVVGTKGGILNFGRPWTLRPRALRLWVKYECGSVDIIDEFPADDPVNKGDPDRASIWIALGDWDYKRYGGTSQCPVQINTTQKSTFFDRQGESVIAYGEFEANTSSPSWKDKPQVVDMDGNGWALLEIPLSYRDETRHPTHMIISIAGSKLGDYFTGSSKSRMWVDDVTLVY